jgi:glycosyltransferase involved in cell wall biosynthesis
MIGGDKWGVNRLRNMVEMLRPALVFLVNNFPAVESYLEQLRAASYRGRIVAYCPIEGGPIDPKMITGLRGLDKLVLYTRFARGVFQEAVAKSDCDELREAFSDVLVLPHGVDTAVFCPHEPDGVRPEQVKPLAKRLLFGDERELWDTFIVLNANRNQPRKRIDTTIEGFALFARDKPANVRLYLHMGITDQGWDLLAMAERYDIADRLILTNRSRTLPSVSEQQLNMIYNACDVGINTASSEGWGLVSFEHGATRTAQIVPRHSALAELWAGSAEMLEPSFRFTEPLSLTEGYFTTPEEVAIRLERVYRDCAHRDLLAERAFANVTRPEYRWENIARQWGDVFASVLQG